MNAAAEPPAFDQAILIHCESKIKNVLWNGLVRPTHIFLFTPRIATYNDVLEWSAREDMDADDGSISSSSSSSNSSNFSLSDEDKEKEVQNQAANEGMPTINRAYHIYTENTGRNTVDAINGVVRFGCIVVRDSPQDQWRMTDEYLAIKEMPWNTIRRNRDMGKKEDSGKECAAMQHIDRWVGIRAPEDAMNDTGLIRAHHFLYDEFNLYVIMPRIKDELYTSIVSDRDGPFTEDECRFYFRQILDALERLHTAGVCHRDLSLENTMVNDQRRVILIDFGMALRIRYNEEWQRLTIRNRGPYGKPPYLAPELHEEDMQVDGQAVDLWSAAVMLSIMLTGNMLWGSTSPSRFDDHWLRHVTHGNLITSEILHVSEEAVSLLNQMLAVDPANRLSLQEIRDHDWMTRV